MGEARPGSHPSPAQPSRGSKQPTGGRTSEKARGRAGGFAGPSGLGPPQKSHKAAVHSSPHPLNLYRSAVPELPPLLIGAVNGRSLPPQKLHADTPGPHTHEGQNDRRLNPTLLQEAARPCLARPGSTAASLGRDGP
ncbi:hypothetical protein JZ751_003175 [Albula glossodonta]|uniref:Uncharacterized protein n=1 Tax=Albula glossodonta TaxID=121402 RepID=A0A8T2NK86_9TELE|nr:hypothetical protein JZ751_003175 [Albula glossodonta]